MKLSLNLFFLRKRVGAPLRPYLQGQHFISPFYRYYPKRFLFKKDFNFLFHLEDCIYYTPLGNFCQDI